MLMDLFYGFLKIQSMDRLRKSAIYKDRRKGLTGQSVSHQGPQTVTGDLIASYADKYQTLGGL